MSVKKVAAVGAAVVGMVAAGAGTAMASSSAEGVTANSPGVVAGNSIQVPLHIPINLCGNSVDAAGALNPAFGNSCANVG